MPLKSHYQKENFWKKIYNNFVSYKKLQMKMLTRKEFSLRKKKLVIELQASAFE